MKKDMEKDKKKCMKNDSIQKKFQYEDEYEETFNEDLNGKKKIFWHKVGDRTEKAIQKPFEEKTWRRRF